MGKGTMKFDSKKFQFKLQSLVNERDSIYNMSSFFFQHKDNAHNVVKVWSDVFEKGTPEFRLSLVYLANEVLHNCKRKGAQVYKDEFKKTLTHALGLLKGSDIVDRVVRVLQLWSERKVLDATYCSGLIAGITSSTGSIEDAKIDAELIKNFSPDAVIAALKEFLILETDTASKERQLRILSVDALGATPAAVRSLKDRAHADAYRQQLDESCQRLDDLVKDLERLVERREALLGQLEKAHMFFAAQYSDVSVVVTAYRKYGEMVAYMRRKVESRLSPSPSSAAAAVGNTGAELGDAPSPPADTADEFGAEVAVLSRREDEMEIESVGSGGGGGSSKQHHQHQDSQHLRKPHHHHHQDQQQQHNRRQQHRDSRRHGSGKSRSRSRSRSRSGSRNRSKSPRRQQQHQASALSRRRSATPTLDERVSMATAVTPSSVSDPPAINATPPVATQPPIGSVVPSWMMPRPQAPQQQQQQQHHQQFGVWRPPLPQPTQPQSTPPSLPRLPPPLPPPPPPIFPPFLPPHQQQQQQTPQSPLQQPQMQRPQMQQFHQFPPSMLFGASDSDDRVRQQQQQQHLMFGNFNRQ